MTGSVLVTGGAGLLGVSWAATVRDRCRVTLALHERTVALPGVAARHLDLDTSAAVARALDDVRPELVVHTAGLTNVEQCEAEPDRAHHVNVTVASGVATACARAGIPMVHISTDHLWGDAAELRDEHDAVSPTNVYGRTKAEAELRVLDAHPDALVVRTNFYGWGPRYRRSFSDAIIDALRAGERVTLFEDVSYTPIVMPALVEAVHALVERKANGILHVVGDTRLTKHAFGMRIAETFGLDAGLIDEGSVEERAELVERPRHMGLSNRRATALLGRPIGDIDTHLAALRADENSQATRDIRNL